jgi:hypothetical protein
MGRKESSRGLVGTLSLPISYEGESAKEYDAEDVRVEFAVFGRDYGPQRLMRGEIVRWTPVKTL